MNRLSKSPINCCFAIRHYRKLSSFSRYCRRRKASLSTTTIQDLPNDLLIDIFSRLPASSITRCKSVCKPWLTLLTRTRFIKFHLNLSKLRNPNLMLVSTPLATNFHALSPAIHEREEPLKLTLSNLPPNGVSVIGTTYNGLFCLSDHRHFLSLWNPSTGEHIQLPLPPAQEEYNPQRLNFVFGFGFDPLKNKCKIIRITYKYCQEWVEAMVYTLGRRSWRQINNPEFSHPSYVENVVLAAPVNGIVHWRTEHPEGHHNISSIYETLDLVHKSIISFNFTTEKFGQISWPDFDENPDRGHIVGIWDDCLAMFCFFGSEFSLNRVDIWVMKNYGVKESWIRIRSLSSPMPQFQTLQPLVALKNGYILLQMGPKHLMLFDPVNKRTRVHVVGSALGPFSVVTYVEALTSIASLMDSRKKSIKNIFQAALVTKMNKDVRKKKFKKIFNAALFTAKLKKLA